ncbi:hypothetical protein Gorai_017190, partial [Gossypium raimondii]|nr:hypothetical protein [Gossypium raimondii]
FLKVKVKGDPLVVIRKLRSDNEDKSEIGAFIRDCQSLSRRFHTDKFQHVKRSTNGVAYLLTTEGLK